jgi:hypothetical protein
MNHLYLVGSSLLLLIPLCVFFYRNQQNTYEIGLAILLCINVFLSVLFWSHSENGSWIHLLDGIFAKISFFLFAYYILLVKNNLDARIRLTSLFILFCSLFFFYMSSQESLAEWCSNEHIQCHILFHIFISIGATIAFL